MSNHTSQFHVDVFIYTYYKSNISYVISIREDRHPVWPMMYHTRKAILKCNLAKYLYHPSDSDAGSLSVLLRWLQCTLSVLLRWLHYTVSANEGASLHTVSATEVASLRTVSATDVASLHTVIATELCRLAIQWSSYTCVILPLKIKQSRIGTDSLFPFLDIQWYSIYTDRRLFNGCVGLVMVEITFMLRLHISPIELACK